MRTKLRIENPNAIEMTLTVTMTLEDWKELQHQLVDRYPSWQLSSAINDMVGKATVHFQPEEAK